MLNLTLGKKLVNFQLQVQHQQTKDFGNCLSERNTHLFKYRQRYFYSNDILNLDFFLIWRVQTLLVVICWKMCLKALVKFFTLKQAYLGLLCFFLI